MTSSTSHTARLPYHQLSSKAFMGLVAVSETIKKGPLGLRLTKEGLGHAIDAGGLEAVIAMEDRQQVLCTQSGDFREGMAAFLGKRAPVYTNT